MSKAAVVIRKSQGDRDDASLEIQREKVPEMLYEMGYSDGDIDMYDLGVHTGFSFHTKKDHDERIDNNEQIQELLEKLKDGEYDHIAAYDYTRICRDDFFSRFKGEAIKGDAKFAFIEGSEEVDSLSETVKRDVETYVKQQEIEKSKEAIRERKQKGKPLGKPPFGLKYSDDKSDLVPREEEFELVRQVIRQREDKDATYADVEDRTGVNRSTAYKICNKHRHKYEEYLN